MLPMLSPVQSVVEKLRVSFRLLSDSVAMPLKVVAPLVLVQNLAGSRASEYVMVRVSPLFAEFCFGPPLVRTTPVTDGAAVSLVTVALTEAVLPAASLVVAVTVTVTIGLLVEVSRRLERSNAGVVQAEPDAVAGKPVAESVTVRFTVEPESVVPLPG